MSEQTPPMEKPVPYWVGAAVACALFGGLALAGLYFLWSWYRQPSYAELEEVPAIPQIVAAFTPPQRQQAGIEKVQGANGQISFTVRAPDATVLISRTDAQPQWNFAFGYYPVTDLLSPQELAVANARFRLLADVAFARSLKVSDEQLAKLKEVTPVATMIVSEADQSAMKAAFLKYESDKNTANQQALIAMLGNVAARSRKATRLNVEGRVTQIQGILTPEQIKPFFVP